VNKHVVREKVGTAMRVVGGGLETAGTAVQRWASSIYRDDTSYLLKNPVMAARLNKSIEDTKAGKFTERKLIDPDEIGTRAHQFLEEYLEVRFPDDGKTAERIYIAGRNSNGEICLEGGSGMLVAHRGVSREHLQKQFGLARYEEDEDLRLERRRMYAAALELIDRENIARGKGNY
jgi:hypothetical protein